MKRFLLIAYLITTAIGVQAATKYRDFTSTDGKTIRAAVKAYDAKKKIVTIERDNRKTAKVPITVFSEADQTYIRDWAVLSYFSSKLSFKISVKRNRRDNDAKSSKKSIMETDVEDTDYEILLENRSNSMFKGLEMEYCIYYEQEDTKACNQGVYCGDLAIDSINPRSKKMLQTEAVSTYTRELNAGWIRVDEDGETNSGVDNIQRGDVHGIWVRVHMTLPSGAKATREMCYPDSLSNSKAWMTSSIRAGIN